MSLAALAGLPLGVGEVVSSGSLRYTLNPRPSKRAKPSRVAIQR